MLPYVLGVKSIIYSVKREEKIGMSYDPWTSDEYIEEWGTEEQKKQLAERRERMQEFLKGIQVLTVEEAMKRSFNFDYLQNK